MKKLWIRIGAEIEVPDDFDCTELNDFSSSAISKLEDLIDDKVESGDYKVYGQTYAPYLDNDKYINSQIVGDEPEVYF